MAIANLSASPRSSAPLRETPEKSTAQKGWVNCFYRYYKGKKLGPYYVRKWKVGRNVHKEYIKPADVERVKAQCQAYREMQRERKANRKRVSTFIDNWDYLGRMLNRYDTNKPVYPQHEAYIIRLHEEGMYITGRPRTRRHVKRHLAKIGGEEMIVTTTFELDGTTKVFMAPLKINNPFDRLKEIFDQVVAEVFDGKKRPGRPRKQRNQWLRPHEPITDY